MSQFLVDFPNTPPPQSGDTYVAPNGIEYFFDGVKWIGSGVASGAYHGIPDQTGNAGKFLYTNGNAPTWRSVTTLFSATNISQFINDIGYITAGEFTTTNISEFINDVGYITTSAIPTVVSAFIDDAGYITSSSLSVTTAAATGSGALSYDPNNGVFTFAPADLSHDQTAVLNVLYVSKSGSDSNDGTTLGTSFLTIKAAVESASAGTTIFVKSGDYTEQNPIQVPAYVSVVGDNLRSVTVRPSDLTKDMFYVNNGCYIAHMTFKDHIAPTAAIAFNPDASAGVIVHSPYVQNCSSITTTGTGMRIDGSLALGLKSMVTDAFTQYNQGGVGIHIINNGYAQLVSVFTICCDIGFLCESGGRCSITNSNSSFGNYALKAEGTSPLLYTATVLNTFQGTRFTAENLPQIPDIGDALQFTGNTNFYTIAGATYVSGTGTNLTVNIVVEERVRPSVTAATIISFYQNSVITAAGHTFEWIGTGIDINTSLPSLGGVPIQENQVVQINGGKVFYTGTDQKGDFFIGSDLTINNNLGTISGRTFTKSLFGIMTPYILAIGR
jgi:hypothetical protein